MEPTLRAGDWLLVDPRAFEARPPHPGDLLVAADPRQPTRWLVKRVADVLPDGRLTLTGDHAAHAADAEIIAPISAESVIGRPWFRYWPLRRAGRLR